MSSGVFSQLLFGFTSPARVAISIVCVKLNGFSSPTRNVSNVASVAEMETGRK